MGARTKEEEGKAGPGARRTQIGREKRERSKVRYECEEFGALVLFLIEVDAVL